MTDSGLRGRVKGLFGGVNPDTELLEQALPQAHGHTPAHGQPLTGPDAERQALQVLVLAQRTADEHVAGALQEADRIRADARAKAEGIAKDALAHAEGVRREAAKVLADARAKAEDIGKEAQANADGVRREAAEALNDARGKAEEIGKEAQAYADGVRQESDSHLSEAKAKAEGIVGDAQAQYQEVVGSLETKRTALQQKIEALHQFDREYRIRLRTFMQSQLRALGLDEQPPLKAESAANGSEPADSGLHIGAEENIHS